MMKPTEEQLKDPKWWDENAPMGAVALVAHLSGCVTWYKFCEADGYYFCRDNNGQWTYIKHGIPAHGPLIYRPTTPAWTGEGLPPEGIECKFKVENRNSYTWAFAKTIGYDGPACVVAVDGYGYHGSSDPHKFRPIRTPEEVEREAMVEKAMEYMPFDCTDSEGNMMVSFARKLYDAGYLRKPMRREEEFSLLYANTPLSLERCNDALDALNIKD